MTVFIYLYAEFRPGWFTKSWRRHVVTAHSSAIRGPIRFETQTQEAFAEDHPTSQMWIKDVGLANTACHHFGSSFTEFLNRCKRIGFCATDMPSVTELHSDADDALFETIMTNSAHILQPYLPERHELTISGIVPTIA